MGVESHQAGSGELRRPSVLPGPGSILLQYHCGDLPRESRGMRIPFLNQGAQCIIRWAEENGVALVPQSVMCMKNVATAFLRCSNQVIGLELSLNDQAFWDLQKR